MTVRKVLLATTALAGVGAMLAVTPASAVEVKVGGFIRSGAAFGNLEELTNNANAREFYFYTDTEVIVTVKGKDDATGTEYGARIEFEGDQSVTNNVDENWIWIRGSWGEIRLGNDDGASDNMKVTAANIAAGTGGIDGRGEVGVVPFHYMNSSDATKIVYYSPKMGGFQLGVSYTPDSGQNGPSANTRGAAGVSSQNVGQYQNWIEAGATYKADMGGASVLLGAQFSMAKGETNNTADFRGFSVGGTVDISGVKVGASWARNSTDVAAGDATRWTLGAGASLGPANVSVTFVKQVADGPRVVANVGDGWNVVLSADVALLPGVALQGDIAIWNLDNPAFGDDDGVTGTARVHMGF